MRKSRMNIWQDPDIGEDVEERWKRLSISAHRICNWIVCKDTRGKKTIDILDWVLESRTRTT